MKAASEIHQIPLELRDISPDIANPGLPFANWTDLLTTAEFLRVEEQIIDKIPAAARAPTQLIEQISFRKVIRVLSFRRKRRYDLKAEIAGLPQQPRDAAIVAKAVVRASDKLKLSGKVLGATIGLSEPTISRLRNGSFKLERHPKSLELSILFLRFYRSLDAIVGGDEKVAAEWFRNFNNALNKRPVEAVQSIAGLQHVIEYLDSRRAPL